MGCMFETYKYELKRQILQTGEWKSKMGNSNVIYYQFKMQKNYELLRVLLFRNDIKMGENYFLELLKDLY